MKRYSGILSLGVIGLTSLLFVGSALSDQPVAKRESVPRVSLKVARDRAKLLHDVYASTLHVMHDRYFHGDRAVVPARAMEDVFSDMKREYQVEARWIAVNLRAMNIDHDPETAFEKKAADEIDSGKTEVESIKDGYYRRAVAIPLSGGCIHCHAGVSSRSTRKPLAGLVISIPFANRDELAEQVPAK